MKHALTFICLSILFYSCGPKHEPLPAEWYILSETNGSYQVIETQWGMDKVSLEASGGDVSEILIAQGGGADVFSIVTTMQDGDYYTFKSDAGDILNFKWLDREKQLSWWKTPFNQFKAVTPAFAEEYSQDSGTDIKTAEEDTEEAEGELKTANLVFTMASLNFDAGNIELFFTEIGTGKPFQFTSEELGLDMEENQFYRQEGKGAAIPFIVENPKTQYQTYEFIFVIEGQSPDGMARYTPKSFRLVEKWSDRAQNTRFLFSQLPSSAFNSTTDGISEDGLRELLIHGKSGSWLLSLPEDDRINASHSGSGSVISMVHYPQREGDDLVVVHTVNESNTALTFWDFREDFNLDKNLVPADMGDRFPEIFNEDFYTGEATTDIPYTWTLEYDGAESYMLVATPNVHMMPEYEGMKMNYRLELNWDGRAFVKQQATIGN